MIIEKDSGRWKRLVVSGVLFIVVAAMIYKNSMLSGTIDTVLQALFASSHPNVHTGGRTLMIIISFLGSPKMDILERKYFASILYTYSCISKLLTLC